MPSETVRERAEYLLRRLLPQIQSHDQAMDNLFYVNPDASPEIRLWSIAAALYVLDTEPQCPTCRR